MQRKEKQSSVIECIRFADNFPVPAWQSGIDGRCDYFNKAWFTFAGRTANEELGNGWIDRIHPDDVSRILIMRRESMEARRPFTLEFRLRRADGYYQWVACSGGPRFTANGNFEGFAGTCFDIDEQKNLEQTLRDIRERFLGFMDNLPGFAWIKDHDGSYVYLNRRAEQCKVFQCDWRGKTDLELFSPEIAAEYQANDTKVRESRKPLQTIEQIHMNGNPGVALVTKFPILDRSRGVVLVAGCSVDITEQIQLEQSLQRISAQLLTAEDKERRRIARELHDSTYQNLVAAGLNLASLSASVKAGVQPAAETLDEIRSIVTETARELRTLAYVLHPPALDDLGLAPAIRTYVEGFSKRTGIAVALELVLDDNRLSDSIELTLFRIIQEALSNMYKHAGTKSASIRLLRLSDSVIMEISDHGRGMPQPSNYRRTGMGIDGIRQRLRSVKGELEIANKNPGTLLRVTIPVKEAS
jgi:PAS domain S-box-containing protein